MKWVFINSTASEVIEELADKDITTKVLERYNDVFADIFNVLVFNKELVKEYELSDGPTASQYKDGAAVPREQERDIVKYWSEAKSGLCLCTLGAENQVKIDKNMPVRLMNYDSAEYKRQLTNGKNIHPVVTIVLNFSGERWNAPTSLHEMMQVPEELKGLVQDYKITVFDVAFLDAEIIDRFKSDFRAIARYFKNKRSSKIESIFENKYLTHAEAVFSMVDAFTGNGIYRRIYSKYLKKMDEKGEQISMCDAEGF